MNTPHDDFQDNVPAYALGTLETPASAQLERHLGECAECRKALHDYQEVLRLLPLGLPIAEPSAGARHELLHRIRTDNGVSRSRSMRGWWPRVRLHALTAIVVVAIVAAGSIYWTASENNRGDDSAAIVNNLRSNPDTQIIPMLGSNSAPQAVAQLFFQPGKTRAGLVVSGLPPLEDDRAYQLWFVDPSEQRYDGGVFNVGSDGQAMVVIDAPAEYAPGLALRRYGRTGWWQPIPHWHERHERYVFRL